MASKTGEVYGSAMRPGKLVHLCMNVCTNNKGMLDCIDPVRNAIYACVPVQVMPCCHC